MYVDLGAMKPQLGHCEPAEQARDRAPNSRGGPITKDQTTDNVKITIDLNDLPHLPPGMSRKVQESRCNVRLPDDQTMVRVTSMSVV